MYHTLRRRGGPVWFAGAGLALLALLGSSLLQVTATRGAPLGAAVIFSATGANPAAIQGTVDAYRAALGQNNGVGNTFPNGRREINWDDVPDQFAAPNNLPADFFNVNSPRGVIFSTPGSGFQVSATAASGVPVRFGNINATYTALFQTFSAQRLFTALASNVTDVTFFVPGTNTPATVSGFGAVFTDVDTASVTSIQYFDGTGTSLGTQFVPAAAGSAMLSFLGATFSAGERVGKVRITSGNAALGPNDAPPGTEIVVMDDFIYGEPLSLTPTVTPTATATITPTVTPTATLTLTPPTTPRPIRIPGDINGDGFVDLRDYGIWRLNFGQGNCGNAADINGDCVVDIQDYGLWRQHFGEGTPTDHRGSGPLRGGMAPAPRGTPGPAQPAGNQASEEGGSPLRAEGVRPAVPLIA
jgi:hypothetical protein